MDIVSLTLPMPLADATAKTAVAAVARCPPHPMRHHQRKGKTNKMMERLTAATKRISLGSSPDDDNPERILCRKLARIIA